mgnify:CR=1 FL=1
MLRASDVGERQAASARRHWSWTPRKGCGLCTSLSHRRTLPAHNGRLTSNVACPHRLWPTHNDQPTSNVGCQYRPLPATSVSRRRTWPTSIVRSLHTLVYRCQTWHGRIVCVLRASANGRQHQPRFAHIRRGTCASGKRRRPTERTISKGLHTSAVA